MQNFEYFDVIVIGLGAIGSSALYHFSKQDTNLKILGIDKHSPPHQFGSSKGGMRIIRKAYFEEEQDVSYMPLIIESFKLWQQLEKEYKQQLLFPVKLIIASNKTSNYVKQIDKVFEKYNLQREILSSNFVNQKFPAFKLDDDMEAIIDYSGGYLQVKKCLEAFLNISRQSKNIKIHENEEVLKWEETTIAETNYQNQKLNLIKVSTNKSVYYCKKLIIAAGPFIQTLLPNLKLPIYIERKIEFFIQPEKNYQEKFLLKNLPIFGIEMKNNKILYGYPDMGMGIKASWHVLNQPINIENVNYTVSEQEKKDFLEDISKIMPDLKNSKIVSSNVCLYTMTPDEHFIIDYYPTNKNIILASPCSGHGFKFASVIGKILCEMTQQNNSQNQQLLSQIQGFSLSRFKNTSKL